MHRSATDAWSDWDLGKSISGTGFMFIKPLLNCIFLNNSVVGWQSHQAIAIRDLQYFFWGNLTRWAISHMLGNLLPCGDFKACFISRLIGSNNCLLETLNWICYVGEALTYTCVFSLLPTYQLQELTVHLVSNVFILPPSCLNVQCDWSMHIWTEMCVRYGHEVLMNLTIYLFKFFSSWFWVDS